MFYEFVTYGSLHLRRPFKRTGLREDAFFVCIGDFMPLKKVDYRFPCLSTCYTVTLFFKVCSYNTLTLWTVYVFLPWATV